MTANKNYTTEKKSHHKARRKKQNRDEDQYTDQYMDLAESIVNKERASAIQSYKELVQQRKKTSDRAEYGYELFSY